ncbi:coniferyl-aldehyde dehydrogenase [Photobacterium sanctipauli]|uniref:Aldehyde dehydrogenase n=4 Tax=Photobacterium sanctipauli TaxID=1342794 RepID=A0A2T3NSX7_9GAMM|nr:coniferyl aldehyde dehydrogenase [Photobacterium sanctipauli]PSW19358.1 coniferyl-aldehyde dehydrogenase [Photobacterium sanctipauli]
MTVVEKINVTPSLCQHMDSTLATQRAAFQAAPLPSLEQRILQLKALKQAIKQHKEALCVALEEDYGKRSHQDTMLSDILPSIAGINYSLRRLKRWMKPSRRHAGLLLTPAKVSVHYQPLGVVGIIVPWNFPVTLSLGPLIAAIGAGNRAMIKLSEFTPATNKVLKSLIADAFDNDYVTTFEGEAEAAAHFSRLPFDHLIFTGSTAVGHHVMRAAADNLTPVTLELGGKSPVLIADDIAMELAVERLIFGKCMNAGQICVAPDYILVPEGKEQAFISEFKRQFNRLYPQGVNSPDFTSVINTRQYQRLTSWLEEAEKLGAKVHPCHNHARDDAQHRMIPHLLSQVPDEATLMQQEIFGPLLPIVSYKGLDQAIDYIQQRPRPLALYLMSLEPETQNKVRQLTHSGGMAINDTVLHVAADDAPFGGIGPSGIGHYHGKEGFLALSHAKTVLARGKLTTTSLITPPYGRWWQKLMLAFFTR